jgi:hypothetical protein
MTYPIERAIKLIGDKELSKWTRQDARKVQEMFAAEPKTLAAELHNHPLRKPGQTEQQLKT